MTALAIVGQAGGFEREFRDWVVDGYGSAALFIVVALAVIALVLKSI